MPGRLFVVIKPYQPQVDGEIPLHRGDRVKGQCASRAGSRRGAGEGTSSWDVPSAILLGWHLSDPWEGRLGGMVTPAHALLSLCVMGRSVVVRQEGESLGKGSTQPWGSKVGQRQARVGLGEGSHCSVGAARPLRARCQAASDLLGQWSLHIGGVWAPGRGGSVCRMEGAWQGQHPRAVPTLRCRGHTRAARRKGSAGAASEGCGHPGPQGSATQGSQNSRRAWKHVTHAQVMPLKDRRH